MIKEESEKRMVKRENEIILMIDALVMTHKPIQIYASDTLMGPGCFTDPQALLPFCNNSDKHYNSPCNISSLTWKAYGLPSHILDGYFVKTRAH